MNEAPTQRVEPPVTEAEEFAALSKLCDLAVSLDFPFDGWKKTMEQVDR